MSMRTPISAFLAGAALAICLGAQAQNTVTLTGGTNASCTYTGVTAGLNGVFSFACAGAATVAPTCTLSPVTSSISPTRNVALTASCLPGPILSYTWTNMSGGPLPPSSASSSGTLNFPTATGSPFLYKVSATNAFGPGGDSNTATITVTAPTVAPICRNTTATATTGGSATITADCDNGPTTFTLTPLSGAPVVIAQVTTSATTGAFATKGTYVYNLSASNGILPNGTATSTVTVTDPPPAGNCVAPAGTLLVPNGGLNMYFNAPRGLNNSFAAGYTVPASATPITVAMSAYYTTSTPAGNDIHAVVSACPGDFTNILTGAEGPCEWRMNRLGASFNCTLPAGTYYLNARHRKRLDITQDSCPSGYSCEHVLNITVP